MPNKLNLKWILKLRCWAYKLSKKPKLQGWGPLVSTQKTKGFGSNADAQGMYQACSHVWAYTQACKKFLKIKQALIHVV